MLYGVIFWVVCRTVLQVVSVGLEECTTFTFKVDLYPPRYRYSTTRRHNPQDPNAHFRYSDTLQSLARVLIHVQRAVCVVGLYFIRNPINMAKGFSSRCVASYNFAFEKFNGFMSSHISVFRLLL